VLDEFRPDLVHFQHLMYLGLDAPRRVKLRQLPVVLTLNEYWLLCARGGQLLMADGTRCERAIPGTCARCLADWRFGRSPTEARLATLCAQVQRILRWDPFPLLKRLRTAAGRGSRGLPSQADGELSAFLERRLQAVVAARDHVDRVLCPSRFLMERFEQAGWPAGLMQHWPYGIRLPASGAPQKSDSRGQEGPLRIAFMGAITHQKGLQVLIAAQRRMPRGLAELHLFGRLRFDPSFWAGLKREAVSAELFLHGPYEPEQVSQVLAQVDVIVVPSVWFENAPIVISEAQAHGLPVVASNMGGMAELVRDGVDGRLFAPGDACDLARVLTELAHDRGQLATLRRGARAPRSLEQDVDDLRELYRGLMKTVP